MPVVELLLVVLAATVLLVLLVLLLVTTVPAVVAGRVLARVCDEHAVVPSINTARHASPHRSRPTPCSLTRRNMAGTLRATPPDH